VADILTKFNDLQKINATSISDIDKLLKDIQSKKISLEGTPFGKKMQDIADEVNSFFDLIYKQALVIKNDIDKQSEIIDSTIKTNQNSINDFLKTAGYNYEVKIEQENENATITLHPIGLENSIENAKDHLSYGERNAFAMVLFMFSAVKKNPDLIILDDPISSFDGNKKFALLNMMFLSSNPDSIGQEDQTKYALLKDKTVLLMTHDFTTILDIVHTLHMCFQNTQAHMLSSKKGIIDGEEKRIIEEKKITHSDFRSFRAIAVSIIKNKENSIVTRVIYLRRLLDFLGEKKEPPYHLLSSLMHGREKPTFETENNREMSNSEIQNASLEIKEDQNFPANIEDFDYFKILNIIQDDEQLKTIYKSSNDYEKVHIFCMYMRKHKDSVHDVLQKYASEFAHIENDSIYQLDPTKFSLIPQYIIEECDRIMGQA
jgi:energy-coupling factor transporter ATP-binding protein EcfA2